MDSLPTYPAELIQRRRIQESVKNVSKYSIRHYRTSIAPEDAQLMEELAKAAREKQEETSNSSDYGTESLEG